MRKWKYLIQAPILRHFGIGHTPLKLAHGALISNNRHYADQIPLVFTFPKMYSYAMFGWMYSSGTEKTSLAYVLQFDLVLVKATPKYRILTERFEVIENTFHGLLLNGEYYSMHEKILGKCLRPIRTSFWVPFCGFASYGNSTFVFEASKSSTWFWLTGLCLLLLQR